MHRAIRRILLVLAGALLGALLVFSAGGGSAAPTILNTEKVERAIEHSSLEQRDKVARVSCPSGMQQEKGRTFTCVASVGKATTRFRVTQLDNGGRVRYAASSG